MTVTSSVSSNPASAVYESLNGTRETTSTSSIDSAESRFLTLLTTQLKNQDPLSPMDNAEVTSQMAQISTVDGIERLNATLAKLIDGQSETQTLQAAALVGHGVLVPGTGLDLGNGVGMAGIELAESADVVNIEIKDANGLVVRTLSLGGQEAGQHAFAWDGTTDSGAQAVDGRYSFMVTATRGSDTVNAERLEYGMVDSVTRQATGMNVNVGRLGGFGINEIRQIL
ncbi:MAG: flagellar hook assembly protein FlgD [Sulfurisoma sp.]|nr:flagellar hook assembly protein FlgD [Sulfurisoma sp.]